MMEELRHLADFAETIAALGIFGGVTLVVLKFGRFTGRMEQSVEHMSKSMDAQTAAICAMRKKNDQDHDKIREEHTLGTAKIHDRIDKVLTKGQSVDERDKSNHRASLG
jgi:hypothetical protein